MSGWIDDLKRHEEATAVKQQAQRDWALYCDRLIASIAPRIWFELGQQLIADIKRLAEKFPGEAEKQLTFDDHNCENRFTVSSTGHRNFTACWSPANRFIDLEFRSRRDIFSGVQVTKDRIEFVVNSKGEAGFVYGNRRCFEDVSERLLRWLLDS